MYLVAVALCAALSGLVDISGAQSCVSLDGQLNRNCGHCTVQGDPHIYTYDPHTLNYGNNPITHYEVFTGFDSKYAISQQLKYNIPVFGVSATFKQCNNGRSCVSTVYYNEPALEVELILPVKASTYCKHADPKDPGCETKIKVNKVPSVFGRGGHVPSFPMVYRVGPCNSQNCQIFVVGSKGISVGLLVKPSLPNLEMYKLKVYATPSLHNNIFGLCGTFTGKSTNHYTPRYGSPITNWSKAHMRQFIETWKISSSTTTDPAIQQLELQQLASQQQGFGQQGFGQQGYGQQGFGTQGFQQQGVIPTGANAATKGGLCPPSRPSCPPTRGFAPPRKCSSDGACAGFDKCCFDPCLQYQACKPPQNVGK